MNQVTNVVISSKNKLQQDTNSRMLVKFKEDFYVDNDEELYICMSSFNMIKSFYACQTGLNDHFQVLFRLPNEPEVIETFDIYIPEGNYDVRSLAKEIKQLTNNGLFQIEYDVKLNKYRYTNLFQPQFIVVIKPITAGIFLGFENGTEYIIEAAGTYSSKFINLSGYTTMIIKIEGDVSIDNTISNIDSSEFLYDKILGIININDVAPMDTIRYEDGDACMFKHKVNNKKIPSFRIQIVNEDGTEFPQMGDWNMILKFEKVKPNNQMMKVEAFLENINYMLLRIYSSLGIPSSLTLEDVLNNR